MDSSSAMEKSGSISPMSKPSSIEEQKMILNPYMFLLYMIPIWMIYKMHKQSSSSESSESPLLPYKHTTFPIQKSKTCQCSESGDSCSNDTLITSNEKAISESEESFVLPLERGESYPLVQTPSVTLPSTTESNVDAFLKEYLTTQKQIHYTESYD